MLGRTRFRSRGRGTGTGAGSGGTPFVSPPVEILARDGALVISRSGAQIVGR
jgi:hypothetical protein